MSRVFHSSYSVCVCVETSRFWKCLCLGLLWSIYVIKSLKQLGLFRYDMAKPKLMSNGSIHVKMRGAGCTFCLGGKATSSTDCCNWNFVSAGFYQPIDQVFRESYKRLKLVNGWKQWPPSFSRLTTDLALEFTVKTLTHAHERPSLLSHFYPLLFFSRFPSCVQITVTPCYVLSLFCPIFLFFFFSTL